MKFDNIVMVVIFVGILFFVGILASISYYSITTLETVLKTVNMSIPVGTNGTLNSNLTNFQDIMGLVVYPFTGLRTSLPYLTYFLIFGIIIALGFTAYTSSKNPVFFIVHLLFTILITYFATILSNAYRVLIENPFMNSILIDFAIYNKVMLYFPRIIFFVSLLFGLISFVSVLKPSSSKFDTSLSYGGDY